MLKMLVVDDTRSVAEAHVGLLTEIGHEATCECDPLRVEARLARDPVDVVVLDVNMPALDGVELLGRLRRNFPAVGVVMATVVDEVPIAVRAIKLGAFNYLIKPLSRARLERVLSTWRELHPTSPGGDPRRGGLLSHAPELAEVFRRLECFAAADVPVLIEGETGTGKELLAEMLHRSSARAGRPFVAVNVAALPPTLFEAELFGHVMGAFTGAIGERAGYLEHAGEGTLLLDEIGDLAPDLQTRLLRVLQERCFTRVGETNRRPLACRLVFATHRDLSDPAVFRADLYYRLSPYRLRLPPLRERAGDVELLARYFLAKYASQYGRDVVDFEPDALAVIAAYEFPGNVRELEGLVSACVLLETGARIRAETLPPHVRDVPISRDVPLGLEAVRDRAIERALAAHHGNQTRAAEALGVSRATLSRWLRNRRRRDGA